MVRPQIPQSIASSHHANDRMKLARRVAAYSAAALATSVVSDRASGAVVPYTPPGGTQVLENSNGQFYDIFQMDIDGDGQLDFELYGYFGFNARDLGSGSNRIIEDSFNEYFARLIAPGETIDFGSLPLASDAGMDNFIGTRGFVGLRFDIPGGSIHFGYLDVEVDSDNEFLTLYGGAYESVAEMPITTPVPEPAALGLLATGAAGLAAWRSRRRRTADV
jgi:hypothetical protein